jgi:hypothetical protein
LSKKNVKGERESTKLATKLTTKLAMTLYGSGFSRGARTFSEQRDLVIFRTCLIAKKGDLEKVWSIRDRASATSFFPMVFRLSDFARRAERYAIAG